MRTLGCLSANVLGLGSWRKFNWWWLCFDVIQNLLYFIWVSYVGDNAHEATTP